MAYCVRGDNGAPFMLYVRSAGLNVLSLPSSIIACSTPASSNSAFLINRSTKTLDEAFICALTKETMVMLHLISMSSRKYRPVTLVLVLQVLRSVSQRPYLRWVRQHPTLSPLVVHRAGFHRCASCCANRRPWELECGSANPRACRGSNL